jgi:hypothetical protein
MPDHCHWRATGRVRHRIGWFGRVILEFEEDRYYSHWQPGMVHSAGNWRHQIRWRRFPKGAIVRFALCDVRDAVGYTEEPSRGNALEHEDRR